MKVFVLIKDGYDCETVIAVYENEDAVATEAARLNKEERDAIVARGGNPNYGENWTFQEFETK